ncbi:MAG TPA: DNA polymerase III subunit delta' [Caulobacteraceae bacterium]|nr:DNA polymerase III subunit delta' [Caulobacteraceae bacterium]
MSQDLPHPRDTFELIGAARAEQAFLDAIARGRLHHAWLLTGPPGVGKATFAYRAARHLMGATPSPGHGLLGAAAEDHVSRLVAGRAHPDLLVLQRDPEDGKTRKQIPVEEARGLPEFFAKTPAIAPWRVAIVDTADDLNPSGANALLKTLEEPPVRGIILLISDRPGALLPTIRSRCRMLHLTAPGEGETTAWLRQKRGIGDEDARRLSAMAGGAPGRAWRLTSTDAMAADDAARNILASLPRPDAAVMLALADRLRGAEGAERFTLLFERLAAQVHDMVAERALAGEGEGLDRWAETYGTLVDLPRAADAVNLDRADTFYTALARLAAQPC